MCRNWIPALAAVLLTATPAGSAQRGEPDIRTSDVDLFYRLYDAAGGRPTTESLQRGYIDAATAGVRDFIPNRIVSAERLAKRVAESPEVYRRARSCAGALPGVQARLRPAFRKLAALYPSAKFPPVTVLIGRNNSGGTSGPAGVLIGLEVICATVNPEETLEDRFVHLIAHEYGHAQQTESSDPDLLTASLTEGVAELIAELTSGRIANHHLIAWTKGREVELGQVFLRQAESKDLSNWLYNGLGTPEKPGDLGYWVGWRIARSYYDRAADKPAALAELIALQNPAEILAESGWTPGH